MAEWIIKRNNKFYARFQFKQSLKLIEQSKESRFDDLQGKLKTGSDIPGLPPDGTWTVYDPRSGSRGLQRISNPKDKYQADMILSQYFHEAEMATLVKYAIDTKNISWDDVLPKNDPDVIY